MFSFASHVLFALTTAALGFALAYQLDVGERSGVILFLALAVAAAVAGLTTVGGAVQDDAPVVPSDAPAPERRAVTVGAPARGSVWPLLTALAVGLLAVGAATDTHIFLPGLSAALLATLGWFARTWSEHPSFTPRVRERLNYRLLVPLLLPLAMVALALSIAFSMSRLLLAVDKNAAVVIALIVALALLLGFFWISSRPRLRSSALSGFAGIAAVVTVGLGIGGAVAGEREFHEHGEHEAIEVVAEELTFDLDEIVVEPEQEVTLEFENRDEDVYHNVAVYEGEGLEARPVFNGPGFPGHDEQTYTFTSPGPGSYVFVCDFHPNMKGTFLVEEA